MKIRLPLLLLALTTSLQAAAGLPIFNATLSVGKEHRFVLIDESGKSSAFLPLGSTFAGYKLKSFDPKSDVLELEKDGQISRVSLVADAATLQATVEAAAPTITDANAVLNKMRFDDLMERVIAQQRKAIRASFQQMTPRLVAQGSSAEEVSAFQKKMMDEVMTALDPQHMKSDMAKIYSDVFTKNELDDMSSFFSTPLGEMMSAKQPVVQERLGAAVQGRMVEVMPRVQRMGMEFAQQQKAKRAAAAAANTPASSGSAPVTPSPKP